MRPDTCCQRVVAVCRQRIRVIPVGVGVVVGVPSTVSVGPSYQLSGAPVGAGHKVIAVGAAVRIRVKAVSVGIVVGCTVTVNVDVVPASGAPS